MSGTLILIVGRSVSAFKLLSETNNTNAIRDLIFMVYLDIRGCFFLNTTAILLQFSFCMASILEQVVIRGAARKTICLRKE
jgi:hypothetical protein